MTYRRRGDSAAVTDVWLRHGSKREYKVGLYDSFLEHLPEWEVGLPP